MCCYLCKWSGAHSGGKVVCGLALHGGETLFIGDGLTIPDTDCPMHIEGVDHGKR